MASTPRSIPPVLGSVLLALLMAGCGDSSAPPTTGPGELASMRVDPSAAVLVSAQPFRLIGTPLDRLRQPVDVPVTWTSSDPAVVEVGEDGLLTAVHSGHAVVTAESEGHSASSAITVEEGGYLGPEGGTLTALEGALSLSVPAGALAGPQPIYVEPTGFDVPDPTAATPPFRIRILSPLAEPATLTLTYDPSNKPAGLSEDQLGIRLRPLHGAAMAADGSTDAATHTSTALIQQSAIYDVGRLVPSAPCAAPEFRQFDFWLGGWVVRDVNNPPDAPPASSTITAEPGGCAIFENFRAPDTQGLSISLYDPTTNAWYQTYMDNHGSRLILQGGLVGADMLLTAPTGDSRITWSSSGGAVEQLGEDSHDQGLTWEATFDLIYRP